jgi:hypothetical protein
VRQAYIYYRIDPGQAAHAAARIDTLLIQMAAYCSQPPRRLMRCDDASTWLEIYEGIIDFPAFAAALATAAGSLDCMAFTLGERHLECFLPPVPSQAEQHQR